MTKASPLIKDLKKYKTAYLMAVPAVVLLFIFHYIPIYGLLIAFMLVAKV